MQRIYVGNLSFQTTEQGLSDLFAEHGTVNSVSIITDRITGRSRGFAFVEMNDDGEAKAAMDALNGKEYDGRPLRVAEAKERARIEIQAQRDQALADLRASLAAQARLSREQAQVSLRRLELQVAQEVRTAGRGVLSGFQAVASTAAARDLATERLDAEQKKFDAGMSTTFLVNQPSATSPPPRYWAMASSGR